MKKKNPEKNNNDKNEPNFSSPNITIKKENIFSSPNKVEKMNFPSKENYFGIKASPIIKTIDSSQKSPIFNYFQCLSPPTSNYIRYTPKEDYNFMNINSLNNFSLNAPQNNNNEEEIKTLQDTISSFIPPKENSNNFIRKSPLLDGNIYQEGKKNDSQSEDENEEPLVLSINQIIEDDTRTKSNASGSNKDKNSRNSYKETSIKSIVNAC